MTAGKLCESESLASPLLLKSMVGSTMEAVFLLPFVSHWSYWVVFLLLVLFSILRFNYETRFSGAMSSFPNLIIFSRENR